MLFFGSVTLQAACSDFHGVRSKRAKVLLYLTSPGPLEIGHNSLISQPILKPRTPVAVYTCSIIGDPI